MTDWVRLWHDMPTDPKWRVVARKSGQPLACVVAVFTMMLTNASGNAMKRGTLLGWDHEDAGAALDMDGEAVAAIYEAMQGKVLDGDTLTGWDRRQPKREDSGVSGRVAKHRETKAAAAKHDVTHGNAPEKIQRREDTEKKTRERASPVGSRLPIGWTLTPDLIAFAAQEGFSLDETNRIAEQFRDHWLAAAGAKARKADWTATWRSWIRRETKGSPNGGKSSTARANPRQDRDDELRRQRDLNDAALLASCRDGSVEAALRRGDEREAEYDFGRA